MSPTPTEWLLLNLEENARTHRSMAARCRKAFNKTEMGLAAHKLAEAHDDAAAAFEKRAEEIRGKE